MEKQTGCIKDPKNPHLYLLPTNSWLRPVKEIQPKLFDAILHNDLPVVVKITVGNDKFIHKVNSKLTKHPNFMYNVCTFTCNHDILAEVDDLKGFCEQRPDSELVTISIHKKYSTPLAQLKNKVSVDDVKAMIRQTLFALLDAFVNVGYVHHDMHIGNMFLSKYTENHLKYSFDNYYYKSIKAPTTIQGKNYKVIISDYNNGELFNIEDRKKYYDQPYSDWYAFDKTLIASMVRAAQDILKLLPQDLYNQYWDKIKDFYGRSDRHSVQWFKESEMQHRRNIDSDLPIDVKNESQVYSFYDQKAMVRSYAITFMGNLFKFLFDEDIKVI
jgi:hypothetical protein